MAHCLPESIRKWLDDWGPPLQCRASRSFGSAWRETMQEQFQPCRLSSPLLVGTDCSGMEAPIYALRGLNIVHRHCWSSECQDIVRQVILANTPPTGQVYHDVLDGCPRSKVQGPRLKVHEECMPPEYVHLYVSGFSCKPFSTLHNKTALLEEPDAEIFRAVVRRIQCRKPPVFLLENVQGISRCLSEVLTALCCNGLYKVCTLHMCPSQMGEPVQRPRIYFFGVRADVSRATQPQLQQILERAWGIVTAPWVQGGAGMTPIMQRLLPADHPVVQENQSFRKKRWLEALGCFVWYGFIYGSNEV